MSMSKSTANRIAQAFHNRLVQHLGFDTSDDNTEAVAAIRALSYDVMQVLCTEVKNFDCLDWMFAVSSGDPL